MDLVIIGLPSLFIRNFASRSSFDLPTFSVSLNVGEHLEGAAAVAMAEVTVEMATKEVVAVLHEARMDLHAIDHSKHQAARKIGFLIRDHYIVEAKDTRAQCKDFGSTHRFEALKHFTTHLAFSKRCITNQNLVKKRHHKAF